MKTKKKGFSLVELICTITIAAIIAAATAPNVSAYIQNSKIQNYQTALNNLVDELQTKLPQTRYWNWQEVQDNVEEILGSDISRNVSAPDVEGTKYTYTLSNVSTDSDVEFVLDVVYTTGTGTDTTTQKISINGKCVGYDAVKSEAECTVLLKTNYVDKGNYPTITTVIETPLDKSGWKPMKNMAGVYSYWNVFNTENPKNNFGTEVVDDKPDAFYLNLTDYPANSCEQVMFKMQRYQITLNHTEIGYIDVDENWIQVSDKNEGDQVTVEDYYYKDNGEKVPNYYSIYSETGYTNENGDWVQTYGYNDGDEITVDQYYYISRRTGQKKIVPAENVYWQIGYYSSVFEKWYQVYNQNAGDQIEVTEYYYKDEFDRKHKIEWNDYWGDDYYGHHIYKEVNQYTCEIRYFMRSNDPNNNGREVTKESKTYQCTTKYFDIYSPAYPTMQMQTGKGTGTQKRVLSDCSTLEVYVGVDDSGNEKWVMYTDVFDVGNNHKIRNTDEAAAYRSYYGDDIDSGAQNAASFIWDRSAGKENIYVKYRSVLPDSTRGWLYITGMVLGTKVTYINPVIDDSIQVYINYHRDIDDKRAVPIILQTGYGINAGLEDGNGASDQRIWIDVSKSGYCVDNVLKITLSNVNADKIIEKLYNADGTINNMILDLKCTTPDGQTNGCSIDGSSTLVKTADGEEWYNNHYSDIINYPTYDFLVYNNSLFKFSDVCTVSKDPDESNKLIIKLKASWSMYPYLYLFCSYCMPGFTIENDIKMSWEDGDAEASEETTKSYIPAATINGNDKYTVLTLDWSKCDYIDSSNLSSVVINFSEALRYTIYDKNYNKIGYNSPCCSNYLCNSNNFYPTLITDANALSDRVVHLYFEGISSSEISYTLSYPESE